MIQAIPLYCMSIFLLPKGLCSDITSHMRKFWWGHQENKHKINWMCWGKMGLGKASRGMGFRDLSCFNRALLAKQCWRLWKNPDNLVARLMRAKYYPDGSILEAKVGIRPSFAWRSISSSCEVLKEGLIWRIGNGATVQIWNDKWIPNPSTFRIVTPPNVLSPNATVKELFEPDLKGWNIPLLEQIISIEEVQLIRSLPISCTNQLDTLIWRSTTNGIFSVRSAYHLQMESRHLNSVGSSFSSRENGFWKKLWGLAVPNVEKNFLWLACHNILPTWKNLMKCKVLQNPECPICGFMVEMNFHIPWQCPATSYVWSMGPVKFQKCSTTRSSFIKVAEKFFLTCSAMELRLFTGLARRLWLRRNDLIHGGSFVPPEIIFSQATRAMEDFQVAQEGISTIVPSTSLVVLSRWEALSPGWVKLNWDAALNNKEGKHGGGVVIRDWAENVLVAKCFSREGTVSSYAAESLAAQMAIDMCWEKGYTHVHLEGDSKNLVDAVNCDEVDWGPMGMLSKL